MGAQIKKTHVAKREKRASFVFHLLPGVEGFQKFVRDKKNKKEGVSVIRERDTLLAQKTYTRARQNAAHV